MVDRRFVKQRSAQLYLGEEELGVVGQVQASICSGFDLIAPIGYAFLDIDTAIRSKTVTTHRSLPEYQLVQRDISLEATSSLSWQDIASTINQMKNVVSWEYLDSYVDKALADAARRVITGRIRFDLGARPSLTQINQQVDLVLASLKKKHPKANLTSR